jgi:UDP-2,3-diacylglucosamine pyrophosphatase LpxH
MRSNSSQEAPALTAEPGGDIIFLSDVHLAAGSSTPGEHFFYDAVFARLLEHLINQAEAHQQRLRLVLLGDTFDFLRVESPNQPQVSYSLDTSTAAAVEKISRIAAGHPLFFQALAWLLDHGGALEIVPGNHDIELIRVPVQEAFIKLVAPHCQADTAVAAIRFHPWVFFLPGVLYAEHGQQQHFLNAMPDLLERSLRQPAKRFRLPIGSYLELFKTSTPRSPAATLHLAGAFILASLRRSLAGRYCPSPETLKPIAESTGLSTRMLQMLYQRSQGSTWDTLWRVFRGRYRASVKPPRAGGYLYQAAIAIHHLLMCEDQSVPYYIFGHSHQPARLPLPVPDQTACYMNAGSWIKMEHPCPKHLTSTNTFLFIRVGVRPGTQPRGEILAWNDMLGKIEPFIS